LTESTYPGLSLLLAHHETNVRVSLTSERRIKALLQDLRSIADVVVIDSPPLLEVAEAMEMAAAVDTVLLCVRLGNTRREKLNQLREMLARRGIIPAGFVVTTRVDTLAHGAYEDAYAGKAPERDRDEGATAREVARVRWGRSPDQ
jgi:Mrp family chromosome partitioning ATPase